MKKRIVSLMLTLIMVMSLVPTLSLSAFAATGTVSSKDDSRIEYMLKNIEYQNFSGSSLTASKVQNYMRHFMFDSNFAAIDGGTFNYPNSGAYTWEVSDGTYNKVAIRGSTGCCAYCYYVSKVVYGVDWVDSSRQTKLYSASQLKNFLLQYAQAGEHLRADPSHSVTFISGDDAGFYCFSYCGDSNPVIHLDYWTYDAFYAKYGGYSIYVYDVFKSDNTNTMGCKDGHHYNCNVVTAPTKTSTGTLRCYCPVCRTTKDVTLPKLNSADYTLKTEVSTTCTAGDVEHYTWKNTEYGTFKFDVQGAAGSHNYVYSLAATPTETEQGSVKGVCSKCGNAVYVTLPMLNLTDYDYAPPQEAPTCTEGSKGTYTWNTTKYGSYKFDKEFAPMGHAYFDEALNTVTKVPTADSEGVLTCTCFRCNEKLQINLPKLGTSEYSHEVTDATCTADGKDAWIWLVEEYGDVRLEKTIPATGHNYVDGVCTHCGYVSPDAELPFTDVKSSHWFYNDVRFVYDRGLMTGVTNTAFDPNSICTRATIVTVLWRMEGSPEPGSLSHFKDVAPTAWYAKQVAWASEQGIVNGVSVDCFDPNANLTREQLAAIMFRYAGMKGQAVGGEKDISSFPDYMKVSSFFKDAVRWAYGNGIIGGAMDSNGVTCLLPQGDATRCQIAAILHRYINNFG